MTTIYIALIEDRHTDVEACAFSTPEAAIDFAKDCALAAVDGDWSEVKEEDIDGWLYHACYSPEGDSVRVVERVLDDPNAHE